MDNIKFVPGTSEQDKQEWIKFFQAKPKKANQSERRKNFASSLWLKVLNTK